jgi:hypothetical protein
MSELTFGIDEKALATVVNTPNKKKVTIPERREDSVEVRNSIKKLLEGVEIAYWELGKLLFEVFYYKYWKDWGFSSFEDYTQSEMHFRKRKAIYLMDIWKKLKVDKAVSDKSLEGLSWTKARQVVRMIDSETTTKDAEKIVETAKTKSVADLDAEVKKKEAAGIENGTIEVLRKKTFALYDGQLKNIREALDKAKDLAKSDSEGHLLDCICLEFNSIHVERDETARLITLTKRIEDVFGVHLVIVKSEMVAKKLMQAIVEEEARSGTEK